jgi:hypothetical protein
MGEAMTDLALGRRNFLRCCSALAILGSIRAYSSPGELSEQDKHALLRMARLLYPHQQLSDEVYETALQFSSANTKNPSTIEALERGAELLDVAGEGNWLAADREAQIDALKSIDESEFFVTVQEAVRTQLYGNPEVWELIGYPGPSAPLGYIDRGFDDIDWLTED